MRYTELVILIEGRATEELSSLLHEFDATLTKANFHAHRDELYHMLMIESEIDSSTVLDNVVSVFKTAASKILNEMQVTVSDDIPLGKLERLVAYLTGFSSSDDDQQIYDMIQDRDSNETLICDIMELVTEHDSGDYFPYIAHVGNNLISSMVYNLESWMETVEEVVEDISQIEKRLATWQGELPEIAQKLSDEQVPLGISMESLTEMYGSYLSDLDPKTKVDNLVYLAMTSSLKNDEIVDEISHVNESLTEALEDLQQCTLRLRHHRPALESLNSGGHNA